MRSLILAAPLVLALDAPASAEATFCNDFNQTIFFGIAYDNGSGWLSSGWLKVVPGECRVEEALPEGTSSYYRGETEWIDVGDGKRRQWSWGNGRRFSVIDDVYDIANADQHQDGTRFEEFSGPIEVEDSQTDVRLNVVEDSTTYTISHR